MRGDPRRSRTGRSRQKALSRPEPKLPSRPSPPTDGVSPRKGREAEPPPEQGRGRGARYESLDAFVPEYQSRPAPGVRGKDAPVAPSPLSPRRGKRAPAADPADGPNSQFLQSLRHSRESLRHSRERGNLPSPFVPPERGRRLIDRIWNVTPDLIRGPASSPHGPPGRGEMPDQVRHDEDGRIATDSGLTSHQFGGPTPIVRTGNKSPRARIA
jgi:hypothetical protein